MQLEETELEGEIKTRLPMVCIKRILELHDIGFGQDAITRKIKKEKAGLYNVGIARMTVNKIIRHYRPER